MNFGTFHGVNAERFPPGQKVIVKIDDCEVSGSVIEHNGRHNVTIKLDVCLVVKTITVTKRFFRKDVVKVDVERFDKKSFFETDVGIVNDDGEIQFVTLFDKKAV